MKHHKYPFITNFLPDLLTTASAPALSEGDARGFLNPRRVQIDRGPLSLRRRLANQAGLRSNLGDLINAASLHGEPRTGAAGGRDGRR
jgi:hypothetical protein